RYRSRYLASSTTRPPRLRLADHQHDHPRSTMTPAPRRALRVLPWLLAACAAGVGVFVALPGTPFDRPWWRIPLVLIALVAIPVAWKVNRMPWVVLAAFVGAALRLGARPIGIREQRTGLTWGAAID